MKEFGFDLIFLGAKDIVQPVMSDSGAHLKFLQNRIRHLYDHQANFLAAGEINHALVTCNCGKFTKGFAASFCDVCIVNLYKGSIGEN